MKLLIVTQTVDTEDPVLGFFHAWVAELAKHVERIEVICLLEGKHALPENVRVHSLGKEKGSKRGAVYALRFLTLAWKLRDRYDASFVHMNEEYVLLAGGLWQFLGKRTYMWRNHYAGSALTDIAASFCTKVFCTSKRSYTAKYRKTELMPVGVDTSRFFPDPSVPRVPHSVLFLARMAESKRPGLVVDALIALAKRGVAFRAVFVGSPPEGGEAYVAALKQRVADAGVMDRITFSPGVRNIEAPNLYRTHALFVNASPSGMFDKTIFEAAACGAFVLASSEDWRLRAGDDAWFDSSETLAARLEERLGLGDQVSQTGLAAVNSLTVLGEKLAASLLPPPGL